MAGQADDISVKALSESLSFSPPCVAKTDGNRAHASSEGPSAKSKFLLAKICFHRLSPPPPYLSSPTIPSLSISSLLLLLIYLFYFHPNLTSFEHNMITRVVVWLYGICWVITRHPSNHPLSPALFPLNKRSKLESRGGIVVGRVRFLFSDSALIL